MLRALKFRKKLLLPQLFLEAIIFWAIIIDTTTTNLLTPVAHAHARLWAEDKAWFLQHLLLPWSWCQCSLTNFKLPYLGLYPGWALASYPDESTIIRVTSGDIMSPNLPYLISIPWVTMLYVVCVSHVMYNIQSQCYWCSHGYNPFKLTWNIASKK